MLNKIVAFINSIGIDCRPGEVPQGSFLPGVYINKGRIVYDADKLLSPGDLLHEAGHLAVLLPDDRKNANDDNVSGDLQDGGAEMAAIAWSWAAIKHLNIPPDIVFHEHGYKGASENLIDNFQEGRTLGVPLLQWFGLTSERGDGMTNRVVFPEMVSWVRGYSTENS